MTTADRQCLHPMVPVAAAWALFLPLTCQYLAFAACAFGSMGVLWKSGELGAASRRPLALALSAWWLWLALSANWSRAPVHDLAAHAWTYSLVLWIPLMQRAVRPRDARQALGHFIGAASAISVVLLLGSVCAPQEACGWLPFVGVTGNQRIAYSLLLALAAALAAARMADGDAGRRWPWAIASLICLTGLAIQDRRTGMVLAPVLLAIVAIFQPRRPGTRAAVLVALIVAVAGSIQVLPQVGERFAEGLSELRAYRSEGSVETSWGMRLRMYEVTAALVGEHPIAGHGLGSWAVLWRDRVHGGAILESHSTPHNEFLLVAVQGGWVALVLLGIAFAIVLAGIRRRGRPALPALLVMVAMVGAGLFNVVLRDAKFALPLLLLAAWSAAAGRQPSADNWPPAARPSTA